MYLYISFWFSYNFLNKITRILWKEKEDFKMCMMLLENSLGQIEVCFSEIWFMRTILLFYSIQQSNRVSVMHFNSSIFSIKNNKSYLYAWLNWKSKIMINFTIWASLAHIYSNRIVFLTYTYAITSIEKYFVYGCKIHAFWGQNI